MCYLIKKMVKALYMTYLLSKTISMRKKLIAKTFIKDYNVNNKFMICKLYEAYVKSLSDYYLNSRSRLSGTYFFVSILFIGI